jgi:hypothetical protein
MRSSSREVEERSSAIQGGDRTGYGLTHEHADTFPFCTLMVKTQPHE